MSCDFNDCLNCKREKCILDDKTTSFYEKEKENAITGTTTKGKELY